MAKANKQQLPGVMAGARADDAEEAAVVRKVTRRLMWFLFMVSAISYLDRINISFAALSMNKSASASPARPTAWRRPSRLMYNTTK